MAAFSIDQEIQLAEVIIETLLSFGGGGSRNIRDIKNLLNRTNDSQYDSSLWYSPSEFKSALELLVNDGFIYNDQKYYLRIKIIPRFLRQPKVRFSLVGTPYPSSESPT